MRKFIISSIIGIATGLANGFFGAGGGTLLVPFMERFLKVEEHKAHATAIGIILPLSIVSAIVYSNNSLDWKVIMFVSIGGLLGGYTGAKFLNKISKKNLHKVFGAFMLVAGVRMIL